LACFEISFPGPEDQRKAEPAFASEEAPPIPKEGDELKCND
jgi:hypothetical protein